VTTSYNFVGENTTTEQWIQEYLAKKHSRVNTKSTRPRGVPTSDEFIVKQDL